MTRNDKNEVVEFLTNEFKGLSALVVCDYKGLDVKTIESLRQSANELNVSVKVAKNSLVSIALKNAKIDGIELKNTNIFVWGDDSLNVSKVVAKFADKQDKFVIKTAYMDNEITSLDKVVALSKMPSRDELIGMLLQTWNAPITNFAIGLNELKKQKEEV